MSARDGLQRRAVARDMVTSWVMALWALGAGLYLTMGGMDHLVSPAYSYLLPLFHNDYRAVGVALLIAALVNVAALGTNSPLGLAVGAILIGTWLWVVAVCMGLAAFGIENGSNLNWVTSSCLGTLFFIRAYNKIRPPSLQPMLGLISLAALWFI